MTEIYADSALLTPISFTRVMVASDTPAPNVRVAHCLIEPFENPKRGILLEAPCSMYTNVGILTQYLLFYVTRKPPRSGDVNERVIITYVVLKKSEKFWSKPSTVAVPLKSTKGR